MRSHLAALVAACFTAAISTPDVGLLVHHHAGGEAFHVHDDLDEPHAHHHDDEDHDHDHVEEHHHHHHDAADHDDDGPGLSEAGQAWTWHSHATRPFHRAVATTPAEIVPPAPLVRLAIAPPLERLTASTIPSRSRGPPPLRSSRSHPNVSHLER